MLTFALRRLSQLLLTAIVSSFLLFVVTEFSPGTVSRQILGPYALPNQVAQLDEKLGLSQSLPRRYLNWVSVLVGLKANPLGDPALGLDLHDSRGERYFGNFGYSLMFKQPVRDVLGEPLRNSALLGAVAMIFIVPLSLLIGILAGANAGTRLDWSISSLCLIITAIPEYAAGVILLTVFVSYLGWLPGTSPLLASEQWSVASQLVLPVTVLALATVGYVARIVRASMAETMTKPFVRTALLKGLSKRQIVTRHVIRNGMIPPLTVLLLQLNWMVGGVVVCESIFAYPGVGRLLLQAGLFGDLALVQTITLLSLAMAGVTQLVADISYVALNPRVRLT
jgi:peptide/nickel transport system permease protein